MAKAHGKNARVLFGDNHVSGDITGWNVQATRQLADVTNELSAGLQWLPGLLSGKVSMRGLFDSAAGGLIEEADQVYAADGGMLTTILPEGLTVGAFAFIAHGTIESRQISATVREAVSITVEGRPDDGVDLGFLLHALTAETVDGQATSVDNGASSAGGGVASLHVTGYTGFTSALIRVQHSPDNSAWSTLASFDLVTAETHQRLAIAGAVDRYTRAWWDLTGAGSITFAVAFARR